MAEGDVGEEGGGEVGEEGGGEGRRRGGDRGEETERWKEKKRKFVSHTCILVYIHILYLSILLEHDVVRVSVSDAQDICGNTTTCT